MTLDMIHARNSWMGGRDQSLFDQAYYFPMQDGNMRSTCYQLLSQTKEMKDVKLYIKENIAGKPSLHARNIGESLHWFLKKNNQTLSSLCIFLESFASMIFNQSIPRAYKPPKLLKSVVNELQGLNKLQVGNFSLFDVRLKVNNPGREPGDAYRGSQSVVFELLLYTCEIEAILDNKLPEEDALRKVMHLDGSGKEGGILSKLSKVFGDTKKDRTPPPNAQEPRPNNPDTRPNPNLAYANLPRIVNPKSVEDICRKDMTVISYMRNNPFMMGKYVGKPKTLEFQNPNYGENEKVVDLLRAKFKGEELDDKLVDFALIESLGCPENAHKWIREKRSKALETLSVFPKIDADIKRDIADKCLYDDRYIYILGSEAVLDAIPKRETDKVVTTEEMLKDETIDMEKRIRICALECFANCFDRINRAALLLEVLSFQKVENRPSESGWWNDWERFTFEDFVSGVESLRDANRAELITCSIMNNQCAVCGSYFHRNNIFELECQCIFCYDCVMGYLDVASGGNIENALGCMNSNCPNAGRVEEMDEETKNNAFIIKYQSLLEIAKAHEQYRPIINKFMEHFKLYMTKRMPHFTPCAHCESGQLQADETVKKMTCHVCNQHTCHSCRYKWFDEHKELSCSKYKLWLSKNHPDVLGLTEAALAGSFVECPECKETYLLQRGGCIHFACRRCPAEFCGFCYQTFFTKKNPCRSCDMDKQTSLHAHHPRNCFYYLRDESCEWLIDLLNTQEGDWKQELQDHKADEGHCTVKETDDDGVETKCGRLICEGFELCDKHLKEFLSLIIYQKHIDPILKYDQREIEILVRRENVDMPEGNLPIEELRLKIKELCPLNDNDEEEEDE